MKTGQLKPAESVWFDDRRGQHKGKHLMILWRSLTQDLLSGQCVGHVAYEHPTKTNTCTHTGQQSEDEA